jgi:hypothetical protein
MVVTLEERDGGTEVTILFRTSSSPAWVPLLGCVSASSMDVRCIALFASAAFA